jgi:uncharacterized membrane protein HdeD (DUF308 family)
MAVNPEALLSSVESNARHIGWAMALRGIIAVVFGVIAIRNPSVAAGAFVIVFAIYALADGLFDLFVAAQLGRAGQRWGWQLFEGIATIALGVIALAYPGITLLALVLLVAIRAITLGIFELVGAFSWEGLDSRWLLGMTGVLSIVLGVLLLASPAAGGLALLWTIGVYAIIYGVMFFALSIRILSTERHEAHLRRPAATAS